MNFKTPQDVTATIRAAEDVERVRSANRAKVDEAANGFPPLASDEATRMNLKVNVNWGEMAVLLQQARRQYYNAFLKPGQFFRVTLPKADPQKQTHWGNIITTEINRLMKDRLEYFELVRSKFASVVAHGIGPQIWDDKEAWLPRYVALEDLRVPTDTELSLRNLEWFAERRFFTEGELVNKVWGKNSVKGWNKKIVAGIVKEYHKDNYQTGSYNYNWLENPEKMAELVKQNLGYFSSDAVPTIPLWNFYYRDQEAGNDDQWYLVVVPDTATKGKSNAATENDWIYKSDKPVAKSLREILHIQYGDLNNKAPWLHHAVRSVGFLLLEPCFWSNMFRCRLFQHGFDTMNIWLRVNDPTDRDRAQKIELYDRCILPTGVEVVPQTQRHQIDPNLIKNIQAQSRQLMAEASASYTQEIDTGTSKEQTATETMAKVSQVNAMMSGLLASAFMYETFAYKEIARRFCINDSGDADAKEFQKECRKQGIPKEWLDSKRWHIEPEVPIGAGNPTMELMQAQALMSVRQLHTPQAQQEILHIFDEAVLSNPTLAQRLAPPSGRQDVTDSQEIAGGAFGALMQGVNPPMRENVSNLEVIQVLMGLLAGKITGIEQAGNMATAQEIVGLQTVVQFIGHRMQMLEQDEAQAQNVKQFKNSLMKLNNSIVGFAQRLQEQQQKEAEASQVDPAAQAKAQAATAQAQQQIVIAEKSFELERQHKLKEFSAEQERKNAEFAAAQRRLDEEAAAKIKRDDALAAAKVENMKTLAAAKPEPKKE